MSQLPQQHYFVANRNVTVTSTAGASIAFEKGKPTHVPRFMHGAVLEKGALPCDDKGRVLDAETAPVPEEVEKKVLLAPEDPEDRQDAITKAVREIAARNVSADFTAGGTPSAQAVSLALGWKVDQKEVRQAWVKARPELLNGGKGAEA